MGYFEEYIMNLEIGLLQVYRICEPRVKDLSFAVAFYTVDIFCIDLFLMQSIVYTLYRFSLVSLTFFEGQETSSTVAPSGSTTPSPTSKYSFSSFLFED